MSVDDTDVYGFVEQFHRLVEMAHERLPPAERPSPLADRLTVHLGGPARELPVVTEAYPPYDHANLQLALDAWRAEHGAGELVGISGHAREHHSFTELLTGYGPFRLGAVDYTRVPVGVDTELTCVRFGLYLLSDGGTPLAVLLRGADPRRGEPGVRLEVMCREADAGHGFLAEVRALIRRHNMFRGKVLSFEGHEFGPGVGPLRFHERPVLARTDVVLPDDVLASVERQVVGVARYRERLRAAGHPLKRGVLLFGPPGTGKTHTVRYLISQLPEFTVVLLSGLGLRFVQEACALARLVPPTLVVLEDVDLVAESRSERPGLDNPLLFQVLNEMDGLAGDADVAFLLTTNRVDLLEPALAQRPGRVDLAVEVPLPDAAGRRALLELYGRGLRLTPDEAAEIVANTEGVTASFFAELARRAELLAANDDAEATFEATANHVHRALTELHATRQALITGTQKAASLNQPHDSAPR
jgi:cell division protease FtsH